MRVFARFVCLCAGLAVLPVSADRLFLASPTSASVINACRMSADTHSLDGTLDSAAFFGDQGQVAAGQAQVLGELHVTLVCTRGAAISLLPDTGQHAQADQTPCGRHLQADSGERLPYATRVRLAADHGYTAVDDPVERCVSQANPLTLTAHGLYAPAEVALVIAVWPQDVRPGAFSDRLVLTLVF